MSRHPYAQKRPAPRFGSRLRGAYIVAMCFLAASCVVAPQQFTEKQAVDVNQEVGRTESDLMVMNIIRAELREPLVYTNYAKFTEALPTTSLSLNLTSPSITQTAGTSEFETDPMDQNQQYLSEVTTPVTSATFKYYYDQGWPASLLLHLLVGEIRVLDVDKNKKITDIERYSNYPFDLQSYQAFDLLANELGGCRFTPMKPAQDPPPGTVALPWFEPSSPTVKDSKESNIAAQACDKALQSDLKSGLKSDLKPPLFCDPNKPEESQEASCVEFIYRSPALVVTYLGDILRQQWFGDINKAQDTDSPKILGAMTYSDACFFTLRRTAAQKSEPCAGFCNAIFVMKNESPSAVDPKGMAVKCEWSTDLEAATVSAQTPTDTAGENGRALSVAYENTRYDLPLSYLNHTETMHTLEIADLLMGYQIGVKAEADNTKKATKP